MKINHKISRGLVWLAALIIALPVNLAPSMVSAAVDDVDKIETADANANGRLDSIVVEFDEAVNDTTISITEFSVAGYAVTGTNSGSEANDDTVVLTVAEKAVADTDGQPLVSYTPGTLKDMDDELVVAFSRQAGDKIAPIAVAAQTIDLQNIDITFSEDMSLVSSGDFSISNPSLTVDSVNEVAVGKYRINVNEFINPGDTPTINFDGSIEDDNNNSIIAGAIIARDGIKPIVHLTAPAAGGTYKGGSSLVINWETRADNFGVGPISLYYSTDDFASLHLLATGEGDDGVYSAVLPMVDSQTVKFRVAAIDLEGNIGSDDSDATAVDSTGPAITVNQPSTSEIYTTGVVPISFSADASSIKNEFVVHENVYDSTVQSINLPTGEHLITFRAIDSLGNVSEVTRTVNVNTSISHISALDLPSGTTGGLVDDTSNTGVAISNVNTNGDVNLTILKYIHNPVSGTHEGVHALGGFYEVRSSDNTKLNFPVTIKVFYTLTELTAVGGDETKIDGIYFYNSVAGKYERIDTSKIYTADTMVGSKNFAGYVEFETSRLAPFIIGYDSQAPVTVGNIRIENVDGKILLKWDGVSGASSYEINIQPAGGGIISTTTVSGDKTELELTGLNPKLNYVFSVKAKDRVGNVSSATTHLNSASGTPIETRPIVPATSVSSTTSGVSITDNGQFVDNTPPAVKIDEPAKDKTDESIKADENQTGAEASRTATTLAILLLAIAAGVGGYYGYEWWLAQKSEAEVVPQRKEKVEPTKGKPASKRRNGRW